MKKFSTKKLVTIALMITIEIILTRFLSIQTPFFRLSFGFIPVVIVAIMYGPLFAGVGSVIADFIGIMLFPIVGAYFPGFTLTAFLAGLVYGIFLYNRKKNLWQIVAAAFIVTVILQLGLDTLWLQMITGQGYLALLPVRVLRTLIMLPLQVICIQVIVRMLPRYIMGDGETGRVE